MQADWQALRPMHFETAMSFATGVSCRAGGGRSSLAERLITSLAPKLFTNPSVGGLLTAVRGLSNMVRPPPPARRTVRYSPGRPCIQVYRYSRRRQTG